MHLTSGALFGLWVFVLLAVLVVLSHLQGRFAKQWGRVTTALVGIATILVPGVIAGLLIASLDEVFWPQFTRVVGHLPGSVATLIDIALDIIVVVPTTVWLTRGAKQYGWECRRQDKVGDAAPLEG